MRSELPRDPGVAEPHLTAEDYARLRDLFHRRTGIYFDDGKRYFVDKRVVERIVQTGCDGFRDYFAALRLPSSQAEMQELTNLLTVNETYFLREEYQFQCLTELALGEVLQAAGHGRALRLWSVPCSTGEEPYSMAISLLEHWPALAEVEVEIVASDIDTQVLQSAREGCFGRRSVQNLPPKLLDRYFERLRGERWRISADLRAAVNFRWANLNDPNLPPALLGFDVIFCRNVLIYFDAAVQRQVIETFYRALNPGGFLFLGHSESLPRESSPFVVRRFPMAVAYQKPLRPSAREGSARRTNGDVR